MTPPAKKPGQARGRRRIDGKLLLGIRESGELIGLSEKAPRSRIERGEIPARRLGGRIVVLRTELEAYVAALPRVVVSVGQETR